MVNNDTPKYCSHVRRSGVSSKGPPGWFCYLRMCWFSIRNKYLYALLTRKKDKVVPGFKPKDELEGKICDFLRTVHCR